MALKSETLLQSPPLVLGGTSNNIEKSSVEEDLEDGEIFDDEEENVNDNEAIAVVSTVSSMQQSDVANASGGNEAVQSSCSNSDSKNNRDGVLPDSTSSPKTTTTVAAADSSSVAGNLKNEHGAGFIPLCKSSNANALPTSDNLSSKHRNSFNDDDRRSSREKKKKRKRQKDGDDDEKHSKEKRQRKSLDKDVLPDTNNHVDHRGSDGLQQQQSHDKEGNAEDDDDDDEMLFVRGASPTMYYHHTNRRHRGSRDGDDDERHHPNDDEDFGEDDDDEYEDEDDDDEDRRRLRLNDPSGRLDRAARRERLSVRGKRRGRGGPSGSRDGISKRRKDDGEICIFYLQGKCHKGSDCPFSHDALPHKKMELCKFYLMDCCNKKEKCLYMHSEFPCKYYHMGLKCYANKNCKFSHGKLSDAMRQVFIKTFGPINSRAGKEFSNKKGSSGKHRQQDGPGDFQRGRENRRGGGSDGNKRGSGAGGGGGGPGGGPGGSEKKIPSLFDIKVSIPTEMRNNCNNNNSDSDGNHTPMPSPPIQQMQHVSDSSRSPPPLAMSPTMQSGRKRRKERKSERGKKSGDRHRSDRNESGGSGSNKRLPLLLLNAETNWDEVMLEHQRLQQQFLAENAAVGSFAEDSDINDMDDDGQSHNINSQFFSIQNENYSNSSNSNNSKSNFNIVNDENSVISDTVMSSSQRSPSPQNDSDTGCGLQIVTQSNDSGDEMFPVHLPKKQRELFLRIKQQQRQANDSPVNSGGGRLQIAVDSDEDSNENSTNNIEKNDTTISSNMDEKNQINDDSNVKPEQHDENWYSSDEEEDKQSSSASCASSLTTILQNLVRLNSNSAAEIKSPTSVAPTKTSASSIFSSIIQPYASSSPVVGSSVSSSNSSNSGSGVNNINPAGISNVDFDINEVSELLSKVKQHFQTNNSSSNNEKKVRDPRLSRSDVGPSGDSPNSSGSNILNSTVSASFSASLNVTQSHVSSVTGGNDDVDLRINSVNNSRSGGAGSGVSAGAGDMDLRNLPFKPAPVHSAATEIDASINSHSPLLYRLIPFVVAKPDYSSMQVNSKVGAADPRLRKTVRVSEESSSIVSSRDPRHRLIDNINKEKTTVPPPAIVQNSDPRQRARPAAAGIPLMVPTTMGEEQQMPPSLMLSQLRAAFPMMPNPGPDMGMMCPPTPRIDDEPPPNFMAAMPTRPNDPRQRHSQLNLPPGVQLPPSLFEAMNAMQNSRQQNFLTQPGDPRSRPPGVPNMPNVVFPGAVRSNDPINRGQYNYK